MIGIGDDTEVLVGSLVTTLVAFIASYLKRPEPKDEPVPDNR
jgi:hypothetical protein